MRRLIVARLALNCRVPHRGSCVAAWSSPGWRWIAGFLIAAPASPL